ncbi:oligosaccharide flippase family protein [Janibacter sp. G56]|uniref:oligosaccharide flippase family protein n=1 Tax=Janibacter sp. G56 TaxID=3418717 RepID=UPI003D07A9C3
MSQPVPPEESGTLDGAQLQDRAVRGVAWTMIHTVVSVPIAFAVNLLLARVLEPEGYGRLAFLTTLIGIAGGILALGLSSAMIQFGAKAHASGRTDEVRGILSSSQGFRLLVVAPVLTLLVIALVDVPTALLILAIVFGVWVPAALDGGPITLFIENKTDRSLEHGRIAMVSGLVVQAGVVAAALWAGTADAVWAARVVLSAAGIALALLSIAPAYRRAVLRPRLPRHFPAGFWRFALPTGIAGLIGELVVSRTEVLFLNWLSTPTAVGLFALAFGVSSHIFAPAQALTGPLIPAIAGLREVGLDKVATAFGRALRASSTVVALLTAAALRHCALTVLVPVLYGHEYTDAAPAVLALGVIGGLAVASGPVSAFVLARLSARVFLIANLCALAIDVALALALIPAFGLWGAVIANAAGTLTRLFILVGSEARDLRLTFAATAAMVMPALVGGAACLLGWSATLGTSLAPIVEACLASLVALALVLLGMRVTRSGLSPADTQTIVRVLPARLTRTARMALSLVTR